ncbi:ankyrin repeat and SAM domain-containing protein 3-like [Uloborus diversus]|uniref:ankyrin repeat and SAM domain-containing protein 3-like n=1 Tax=Uloborus diversus TaxID=327109 RepID=UPI0024099A89|nr:ankyrin repeat and SAM domain-containing protein 3-like [Uloborus diversus]
MISTTSGHYGLFEAIRYKRHRQAMLLAEAGIDVNCRNERGQTPLIFTVLAIEDCSRSRTKLVKLFLESGADPNATDWKGMTVLMHASALGQVDTVKCLLEYIITNPCVTDANGNTALMYAASHGHDEVVAVFISIFRNDIKSLQLHKRNNDGFTALHLAVKNRHESCARLLTREVQFFPSAIEQFPDPKELDREPTPPGIHGRRKHKLINSAKIKISSLKSEGTRTTGTMTIDSEDSDSSNSCLSVLECSVGDLPISNYTHPFGLQTTKSTQVVSVENPQKTESRGSSKESSTDVDLGDDSLVSDKIDDWPAIPMQLKTSSQKQLDPLVPIEAGNGQPLIVKTFQRKCLLKQNNRSVSALRIHLHESRDVNVAKKECEAENILCGSSIKPQQNKNRITNGIKNEALANLLPIIPCNKENGQLPPVRYTLRRSGSSKQDTLCFPSASYISVRADQSPREIEMFKKNIVALS